MGECANLFESEEMKAIKRMAQRRFNNEKHGPSTDYLDRHRMDEITQELIDEFIIMNGRHPKRSCFE